MHAIQQLHAVQGEVLEPHDAGFDAATKLWNARSVARPRLVIRPAGVSDVVAAIDHARRLGAPLGVKGGGHAYAGVTIPDDGLLLDLGSMAGVDVDEDNRTAMVRGGATCGMVDEATQRHGLATPLPTVSSVGVVGAALGGGGGWLSRRHGLTVDNVRRFEMITADGREVQASADEHADLFWALRGGGGNFGVVTGLELALHEVGPDVLAGQIVYPFAEAVSLLRAFRDLMPGASRDFQCYPFLFRAPPIDAFPAEWHGQLVLDFVVFHRDPTATEAIGAIRALGTPIVDAVGPAPYLAVQQAFDAALPGGQRYYSKAHDLAGLSDAAIDTIVEHASTMKGDFTNVYLDPHGGADSDVDRMATAFDGRQTPFGFHCVAGWSDAADDQAVMTWTSDFHAAMAPHATGGVYVNLLADDEPTRVRAAYGDNWDRLRDVKAAWDPDNVFRANHNIPPAS